MLAQDHQEIGRHNFNRGPDPREIDGRAAGVERKLQRRYFRAAGLKHEAVSVVLRDPADAKPRRDPSQFLDQRHQCQVFHWNLL